MGKTRLALELAARLENGYRHGVRLVELAALADPLLVPQTVAAALDVPEESDRPLQATLLGVLRDKHLLIVMDNCEHVVVACALLVDTLLRDCPDVRVLATSREALGVAGEVTWRVPPLSVPDPVLSPSVEIVARSEAVRLFVERATATLPGFALTERTASDCSVAVAVRRRRATRRCARQSTGATRY